MTIIFVISELKNICTIFAQLVIFDLVVFEKIATSGLKRKFLGNLELTNDSSNHQDKLIQIAPIHLEIFMNV